MIDSPILQYHTSEKRGSLIDYWMAVAAAAQFFLAVVVFLAGRGPVQFSAILSAGAAIPMLIASLCHPLRRNGLHGLACIFFAIECLMALILGPAQDRIEDCAEVTSFLLCFQPAMVVYVVRWQNVDLPAILFGTVQFALAFVGGLPLLNLPGGHVWIGPAWPITLHLAAELMRFVWAAGTIAVVASRLLSPRGSSVWPAIALVAIVMLAMSFDFAASIGLDRHGIWIERSPGDQRYVTTSPRPFIDTMWKLLALNPLTSLLMARSVVTGTRRR